MTDELPLPADQAPAAAIENWPPEQVLEAPGENELFSAEAAQELDEVRARYNVAVAYNNLAYLADIPDITSTHATGPPIERALHHCREIVAYIAANPGDGEKKRRFREDLRLPTELLLAGILAVRDALQGGRQPSPRRAHLMALAQEVSLPQLLDSGANHLDLVDWLGNRIATPTPRSAYNLACYWSLAGDDRFAMRSLAIASTDAAIARWAPRDPALATLIERCKSDVKKLLGEIPEVRSLDDIAPGIVAADSALPPPFPRVAGSGPSYSCNLSRDSNDPGYVGWCLTQPKATPARVDLVWRSDNAVELLLRSRRPISIGIVNLTINDHAEVLGPLPSDETQQIGGAASYTYEFRRTGVPAPSEKSLVALDVSVNAFNVRLKYEPGG